MPEQIEQYMRTLKLGGMAREWRNVEFQSTEQYVRAMAAARWVLPVPTEPRKIRFSFCGRN